MLDISFFTKSSNNIPCFSKIMSIFVWFYRMKNRKLINQLFGFIQQLTQIQLFKTKQAILAVKWNRINIKCFIKVILSLFPACVLCMHVWQFYLVLKLTDNCVKLFESAKICILTTWMVSEHTLRAVTILINTALTASTIFSF